MNSHYLVSFWWIWRWQAKTVLPVERKHRTVKCGKSSWTVPVCCHGLSQNSTEGFLLNWQWNENGKFMRVSVAFSFTFFSFLLSIKNYIKIMRRGVVKKKRACHVKGFEHLPRLADAENSKRWAVPTPSSCRDSEARRGKWLSQDQAGIGD